MNHWHSPLGVWISTCGTSEYAANGPTKFTEQVYQIEFPVPTTFTPTPEINVPDKFIKLASEWYDGMSDKMYAIASTGNLTMGNVRPWNPDEERPCTDMEWHTLLFSSLSTDIGYAIRSASGKNFDKKPHKDYGKLCQFQNWANSIVRELQEYYGIDD